jgi:hypothetical protein
VFGVVGGEGLRSYNKFRGKVAASILRGLQGKWFDVVCTQNFVLEVDQFQKLFEFASLIVAILADVRAHLYAALNELSEVLRPRVAQLCNRLQLADYSLHGLIKLILNQQIVCERRLSQFTRH